MNKNQKIAKQYLKWGLNPVPVNKDSKEPMRLDWTNKPFTEDEVKEYTFDSIGICTGLLSGGIEAIDFDLKNAEDSKAIMNKFKSKVSDELLKKLVVQTTISGGYHMIYRCEDISSSKKLAMNKNGQAIIETRGLGGYIKCAPSDGYKLIQGSFEHINIITPEERLQLFISAKMLNEQILKEAKKKQSRQDSEYIKKFPEYNGNLNVGIKLLEKHGWTVHSEDDQWINFTRPDSNSGELHAGYNKDGMFFWCWSTSQDVFEVERPYNNHAIFAELECDGNYSKAYAILYDKGHGDKLEKIVNKDDSEIWKDTLDTCSFLSDEVEENEYIDQAVKDEISQGLSTGFPALDEHLRLKEQSLNIGLGLDGVGKSVLMLTIAGASAVLHDWKWGMVMPENRTSRSRIRLIETLSGKPIRYFKYHRDEFDRYMRYARDMFKIISNKKHYSIDDVLEMGKVLYEKYGIKALLIDPYNFFKVTGDGYKFNNDILSKMRVYAETYCSIYLMAHPSTTAPRSGKDAEGYLKPPTKYDIQGGADFPYRVDDFYTIHRIVNHEDGDVRREVQVCVEKVKETETGGKVHDQGTYTGLTYKTVNGFTGYFDINDINPFYEKLKSKNKIKEEIPRIDLGDAF